MSRRTNTDNGRGIPWELARIERDADRQQSFADTLRAVAATGSLDFQRIAADALRRVDAVLSRWLPDGRRQGSEWVARNPTRADTKPGSFSVNRDTGRWADF